MIQSRVDLLASAYWERTLLGSVLLPDLLKRISSSYLQAAFQKMSRLREEEQAAKLFLYLTLKN